MTCLRCQGLMVPARLEEASGATSGEAFAGWRCLSCGEVIDAVIAANRKGHREPTANRARLPYSEIRERSGGKRKATSA